MIFKKMLITDDRSDIGHISYYGARNLLLAVSDSGDTYSINEVSDNVYGYGNVPVYGTILDGLGWEWVMDPVTLTLVKSDNVINASLDDFSIVSSGSAYGTNGQAVGKATYISNILSVGDEFGFWKTLSWSQNLAEERVVVAVKSGNTVEEVTAKDWEVYFESPSSYYEYGAGSIAQVDLDRFNLKGSHFMFKVDMETRVSSNRPSVRDLKVSYSTKHSVFFFTNRIKVEAEGFNDMILTASSTLPSKTEVSFGVGPGSSIDWEDYTPVDLGKLVNIPKSFGNRSRVGIRLTSFDTVNVPIVHEFALEFNSDDDNQVNIEGLT